MKNLPIAAGSIATLVLAAALAGCGGSPAPYAPAAPVANSPAAVQPAVKAAMHEWGRSIMRVPLPSAGCFEAAYPAVAWSPVACAAPVRLPLSSLHPALIGNDQDYAVSVSPRHISTATGSFPKTTGLRLAKTVGVPAQGGQCICGDGNYSLQLNSEFFPTAECGTNAHCVGWEQLLFFNPIAPRGQTGQLFTQDWLVKTTATPLTCPTTAGWTAIYGDCYYSSAGVSVPKIPATRFDELALSLSAGANGDSGFLTDGTTVYGMKDMQGDFMDLRSHWTGAEFNVFGDCCYSKVTFNPGATITVMLEADDGTTAAPMCLTKGTTGETNSLSFVGAPSNPPEQKYPSILFTESDSGAGGHASCDAVAGL